MSVTTNYLVHEHLKHLTGQTNALGTPITPYLALFSTVPTVAGTGGVEETGAKLARKNASGLFGAPSNREVSNNVEIDLGAPTQDLLRVYAIGIFSAASGGTLHAICRLHGPRFDFSTVYATDNNRLVAAGHPYQNGDRVQVVTAPEFTLPAGLAENTTYYVVNRTTGNIELSLASGGAPIDIIGDGFGYLVKDNSKLIENGDPVKINAGELKIGVY